MAVTKIQNTPGPDCDFAIRIKFKTLSQFQRDYEEQLKQGSYFLRTKKSKPLGTTVQLIFILESMKGEEVWSWGAIEHIVSKKESLATNHPRGIRIALRDMDRGRQREIETLFGHSTSSFATVESRNTDYGHSQFSRTRELEERVQDMLRMSLSATHYVMLGIRPDASFEEVNNAYQKRVREFHPDQYFRQIPDHLMENLQTLFAKIQRSYQTLADNNRRASYDVSINNYSNPEALRAAQSHERLKSAFSNAYKKNILNPRQEKLKALERAAESDYELGNYRGAFNKYKLALHLDPLNGYYKRHVQNLETLIKEEEEAQAQEEAVS